MPRQVYIEHEIGFNNLFRTANGNHPCFVSQYVCPTHTSMVVDKILFEFDANALHIPYKETRKLKRFCEKIDEPYSIDFSGRKGFHLFISIKPVLIQTEKEKVVMKNKVVSIQLSLKSHLGLNCLDLSTIGKLRLPIRYPTSKYVDKNGNKNGNYCRHISAKDFDKGLSHILKLAKEPGSLPSDLPAPYDIDQLASKIPKFILRKRYSSVDMEALDLREGVKAPSMNVLTPCMQKALSGDKLPNPPHELRVEITCWLKFIGYRDIAIMSFYKKVHWRDYSYKKTMSNVRAVKARHPKCSLLREFYGNEPCQSCALGKHNGKT